MTHEWKLKPEFENKKVFIFDLDGTIYRGNELIEGADNVVRVLNSMDKELFFLTNNATKSIDSFYKKLINMGIECTKDRVISSGLIATRMLKTEFNVESVFIVGSNELMDTAEQAGIKVINRVVNEDILYAPFLDKSIRCDAVLSAMDTEFTYAKLRTAMELINRGAEFFATNADKTLPETKQIWPGSGTMMAAIQTCTDKPPKIIFGKPNRYGIDFIFKTLQNKYNTSKNSNNFMEDSGYLTFKDFLIIGDRLETDIAQGNNLGIDTVLVETGIHKKKDIPQNFEDNNLKKLVPKFILKNLFEFFL